jgi:DNA-binding Lrp family transcriptional regulator
MRRTLDETRLDAPDRAVLAALQVGFPISHSPFAAAAEPLGLSEEDLIARLARLREIGAVTGFGPFYETAALGGAFCLCAMAVPGDRFEAVMIHVNAQPEVARNHQRAHRLNMWFMLATQRPERIARAAARIERETGLRVLRFPDEREFFPGFRVRA